MDERCLSDSDESGLMVVIQFLGTGQLRDFPVVYEDLKSIFYDNKDNCGV